VPNVSSPSTVELVTKIWQRLLQTSELGADDNFFDVGGDSALAVQLFAEIAQTCGRQFPPVMIYHVPTIASQVELIEQPSQPELSPLIPLKSGEDGHALFIAPGLGGGPAEFLELANHIDVPQAIYGLQPKGIEGFGEPSERIEEMAEFYLQALRQLQPHGPYTLIGYSLGGLVTLEMARTLLANNEKIGLLLLLDAYPHINALSASQRLLLLAQRAKYRLSNFGQPERTDIRLGGLESADDISTFAPAFDRVRAASYTALRDYRPSFYPGKVKFVRAAEVSEFPEDPVAVWSHLVADLEVETIPGDHLGMLTTHYEALAALLTRYLKEAAVD
jgi:thioesterase domain-containing protein/acyl carrier protein